MLRTASSAENAANPPPGRAHSPFVETGIGSRGQERGAGGAGGGRSVSGCDRRSSGSGHRSRRSARPPHRPWPGRVTEDRARLDQRLVLVAGAVTGDVPERHNRRERLGLRPPAVLRSRTSARSSRAGCGPACSRSYSMASTTTCSRSVVSFRPRCSAIATTSIASRPTSNGSVWSRSGSSHRRSWPPSSSSALLAGLAKSTVRGGVGVLRVFLRYA